MSYDYRDLRWTTGVKVVANPIELNVMNVMCNNNKQKLNILERKKIEKDVRSKKRKKIRGTGSSDNISNGASLPEDIIFDILPMLPVKSLLRFRCVCKSWNKLFETTSFAELQLDYSLKNRNSGILIDFVFKICHLDYDSLTSDNSKSDNKLVLIHMAYPSEYKKQEILGSCNGLVCYRSSEIIIFWNPYTTVYKKTSPPPDPGSGKRPWGVYRSGFCYDSKTKDYILVLYRCRRYIHIYVYSLKLDSWKTITNIPYGRPSENLVFFKGFFNWVDKYNGHRDMSCFDIDTDNKTVKLKHIPLPQQFQDEYEEAQACLLGGCLCVIGIDREKKISEVWTMKDYGVAESWTKVFTIDNMKLSGIPYLDLKQSFKRDAIFVHHYGTSTFLYDLKHEVARQLKITRNTPGFQTWDFLGSLVSPNLGT